MSDVTTKSAVKTSLGEMVLIWRDAGVSVPNGFATTSYAFNQFLDFEGLDERIHGLLDKLDVEDVDALKKQGLQSVNGCSMLPSLPILSRTYVIITKKNSLKAIQSCLLLYAPLLLQKIYLIFICRVSRTFLNVSGIDAVLEATKHVYASLFNDRAISYRVHQGFDHRGISLSAGIQRMVRSDKASSEIHVYLDTESGFDKVVFILPLQGLGEMVVQGAVNPDEFYISKANARGR